MTTCIVCGMQIDEQKSPSASYSGQTYYFASGMHRTIFTLYPELFLNGPDGMFRTRSNAARGTGTEL